jgi:hypothetical protein
VVATGIVANLLALIYVLGRRQVAAKGGGKFPPEQ